MADDDYVADCPISVPLYVPNASADVDLGGLKFSYQLGLFYTPTAPTVPIQPPPSFEDELP